MKTFHGLNSLGLAPQLRSSLLIMLFGVLLAGCGGGGGGDDSPNPPAPPPPPPPPPPGVPPQSTTVISLDDHHQVGVNHWADGNTSTGGQGGTVSGLECLATMPDTYHVHTHLSIFLNGEALAVPAHAGIVGTAPSQCFYTVHTHDKTGLVHVEAAAAGTFTLGQFFAVWGQPLSGSDIAGLSGMPVKVYVTDAGVVTEAAAGTWENIELRSHREITIQVGTAITAIPNFSWSSN